MGKVFKIIITIFTFIVVLAFAVGAGYWSYFIKHWPWWIALAMATGVLAFYFLILFFKKYFIRRREKKFVQRIVDHGEVLAEGERPERQAIQELEQSWKTNLDILKKSHLTKHGNPLYVLPWYLAMGESGVGKSTLLANAGITSSFTELEDRKGQVAPTRSCDWFFFDKAIILDAAGRYSIPLASDTMQNEWKRFLFLLAKNRRKQPLNGIILFVAADELRTSNAQILQKKGQVLRNRIHSLMRTIGFKVPILIMVTKMDTVPGFVELATLLSDKDREQAMGRLNHEAMPSWKEVLEKTFASVDEGLQKIRFNKISQPGGKNSAFFSFPSQMASLEAGLEPFLEVLFSENSYQETPVIQGIYFGSGLCKQTSLADSSSSGKKMPASSTPALYSVFVKELFSNVLPANRWSPEPVKEFLLWRKITRNLALLSLLCVIIFTAGIIGLSYLHNQHVFSMFPTTIEKIDKEQPGSNAVVIALEKMRLNILDIENANRQWKLPFSIFSAADKAEYAYKKEFCHLFTTALLNPVEQSFEKAVETLPEHTSADLYADYIGYLVEQINSIQHVLAGKKRTEFTSFSRVATAVLSIKNKSLLADVGRFFPDLNASYLDWTFDRTDIEERLLTLQGTLRSLLAASGGEISWLYSQSITDTPSVTLADFWKFRQLDSSSYVSIPGAFTKKGRTKIENFLDAISNVGMSKDVSDALRQGYLNSYPQQFVHWWGSFGRSFENGELGLHSDTEWREVAIRMTTPTNPYFMFLATVSEELVSFAKDTKATLPDWGKAAIAINDIRQLSLSSKDSKQTDPSLFAKVTSEKNRITTETLQQVDPARAAAMNEKLQLAEAWGKYETGLADLDTITPYQEKAARQFSAWFELANGNTQAKSVFGDVYDAWIALKSLARGTYDTPVVWKIVYGPFNFLQDFAAKDTAQVLQEKWHEDVLSLAPHVDPDKRPAFLFDKDSGVVWKYIKDYADPFIMKSASGYTARDFYGRALVFEPSFYTLLNQGKLAVINAQPQYTVTMTTKPMAVNDQAMVEPYYSIFSMQCAKKSFVLENDNFPKDLTVDWAPDKCGDVLLKIGFPTMELTKKWTGKLAYAHFLKQFKTGGYSFTAKDFPDDAGHLKDKKVEYINISYVFSGEQEVLQLLHKIPQQLPTRIVEPENQISARPYLSDADPAAHFYPQPMSIVLPKDEASPDAVLKKKSVMLITHPDRQSVRVAAAQITGKTNYHQTQWLLDQQPQQYTVQIMSLQSADSIQQGFSSIATGQDNAVYSQVIKGVTWYVLLSGRFETRKAADDYLKSLPQSIRKDGAFVRSFTDVQKMIR